MTVPDSFSKNVLLEAIPLNQSLTNRWDQEWLVYFLTEDPRPFFVNHEKLEIVTQLEGKSPAEVYQTILTEEYGGRALWPLNIWIEGDHLVGKNILEIGCGPGLVGKQLSKVASSYLGLDYSLLALNIARLTSPANCTYYHLSEIDQILGHASNMDTMIGRNFFIHQNYQNLLWLLKLAYVLLKPGGRISADFYQGNPAIPQGVIHSAHNNLDEQYPSCGFEFSTADIQQAAHENGFVVESLFDNLDLQRRFVQFVKRSQSLGSVDLS